MFSRQQKTVFFLKKIIILKLFKKRIVLSKYKMASSSPIQYLPIIILIFPVICNCGQADLGESHDMMKKQLKSEDACPCGAQRPWKADLAQCKGCRFWTWCSGTVHVTLPHTLTHATHTQYTHTQHTYTTCICTTHTKDKSCKVFFLWFLWHIDPSQHECQ